MVGSFALDVGRVRGGGEEPLTGSSITVFASHRVQQGSNPMAALPGSNAF